MTNTNDRSAQNGLKEATSILNDVNILALKNLSKEEELHSTHSFEWRLTDKKSTNITCNKVGTIENSLRKSAQFRKIAEKNKHKELVITRDGKALSSHSPCSLMQKDECLTVSFIKAIDKPKKPVGLSLPSILNKPSCELVAFHVMAKGGKNIVKILRNPALKTKVGEITVYAYKGEKVKQALKRDGRFLSTIFKKNFVLSHGSTGVKTELSNLVDDLNGETFQIILLDKSSPPNSQFGSLEDAYLMPDTVPNEAQSQSVSENGNTQIKEPDFNGNIKSEIKEKHSSELLKDHLNLQFIESLKGAKKHVPKLSRIQNLLRVEFGQNAQMCNEVKTMKRLMDLADSVCQVRINGRPEGSGFLLFGSCVLTNGHVIKNVYDDNRRQLDEKVSVHFSYESVEQTDGALDVEEVVCFEYDPGVPGKDWALLRLGAKQTLPSGLLKYLGFHPEDGGLCIIGHPGGGVKKIDPCLMVASQYRSQVAVKHYSEKQEHVQLVGSGFFEGVAQSVQAKDVLTYETCFYGGSSGSPVCSKHCRVVAMHTGGYTYKTVWGETRNVIEFAQSLPLIVVRLIIQMVERKRVDVLMEYLDCSYDQRSIIMDGVKKLVESRNLTTFRESVNSLMETSDTTLRSFLEFFSENPVPMETD